MDEKTPLIPTAGKGSPAVDKSPQAAAVTADEPGSQRDWDGHLLKMCGSCDQDGLSTFAYVKLLSPLAYGHNFKRAFGGGFWKHCIIFALLFTTWGYYFIGASSRVAVACGPNPPIHPDWRPDFKEPRAELPEPRGQQILTGATLNPEFMNDQQKAEWVDLEGTEEVEGIEGASSLTEDGSDDDEQLVMNQIQTAKVQAAEGMAQLGAGRRLLHKHKHNDDHEHDDDDNDHKKKGSHKHKDEDHKDKEDKKGKHGKKDKHRAPRDKMLDGPKHGPESPECEEAQTSLGAVFLLTFITFFSGIIYATRMRTALRERFGIKGSKFGDCVAWSFCAPCALCQETRTIAKNNVYNGVWHGQTVLTEAPAQPLEAPTQIEAPTKPV